MGVCVSAAIANIKRHVLPIYVEAVQISVIIIIIIIIIIIMQN